jgi:hypothetical protein
VGVVYQTRKILKKNGMVMYRSSVRSLTLDEIQSPTELNERQDFDTVIEEEFGPAMNKNDFQDDPDYTDFVTPTFDCYEDDEVPPSRMSMMLILMTNMLAIMSDSLLEMRSNLENLYGASVSLMAPSGGEQIQTQCKTHIIMKFSSLMAAVMNTRPM